MTQQQYYKLTLEEAIALYQAGDITAKGLVHFYILIKLKPGWKIRLEHKKICKELGIAKTAFYNAISRLKAEGAIDWEAPEGILVSISDSFRECGKEFTSTESESATAESEFAIAELESATAESKSRLPAPGNDSDDLPNSYQIFINSLTGSEREKFIDFGKKRASKLPEEPVLLEKWIEKNYSELWGQFQEIKARASSRGNLDSSEQLHPCIKRSFELGEITIDPIFKGLWDCNGNWWKQEEWIAMHGGRS